MSKPLTVTDLDAKLDAADAQAKRSLTVIYSALGALILALEPHIQNPAVRDHLEAQLIDIDGEARGLKETVLALTQEMTVLATFTREIQQQRENIAYALNEALKRADCAESTAAANIYQNLLDNIEETFNCTTETAHHFLHALWDASAPVDDAVAELLDRVANTIDEWE